MGSERAAGQGKAGVRSSVSVLEECAAFLCWRRARAELGLAEAANQSAHEATEDVFGASAERNDRLNIGRRARAQGAGDLDCGAGFTALAERDGVRATLVSARLASRALRAIERCRRGGFACLSAQLRVVAGFEISAARETIDRMSNISVEKSGDLWLVKDSEGTVATWRDLEWAAYSALCFSKRLNAATPSLGEGVPKDALEQGGRLWEILNKDK